MKTIVLAVLVMALTNPIWAAEFSPKSNDYIATSPNANG